MNNEELKFVLDKISNVGLPGTRKIINVGFNSTQPGPSNPGAPVYNGEDEVFINPGYFFDPSRGSGFSSGGGFGGATGSSSGSNGGSGNPDDTKVCILFVKEDNPDEIKNPIDPLPQTTDYQNTFIYINAINEDISETVIDRLYSVSELLDENILYVKKFKDQYQLIIDFESLMISETYSGRISYKIDLYYEPLPDELFVEQISPDRTEIKLKANRLPDQTLRDSVKLRSEYYLFTYNEPYLITNMKTKSSSIILKLDGIISDNVSNGSITKIFRILINEISGDFSYYPAFVNQESDNLIRLRYGSRYVKNGLSNSGYFSYSSLIGIKSSKVDNTLNINSGSIAPKAYANIDYSDLSNFIKMSRAETRIDTFMYKVNLIETLDNTIRELSAVSASITTSSLQSYADYKNTIISTFDGFENYLYYSSGSAISSSVWGISTYPKDAEYNIYSSTSSNAINWYNETIPVAIQYDNQNINSLVSLLPETVKNRQENKNYVNLIDMLASYIDSGIYLTIYKHSDIYNFDNRLDYGNYKEFIPMTLESLGWNLYNFDTFENLYDLIITPGTGVNEINGLT